MFDVITIGSATMDVFVECEDEGRLISGVYVFDLDFIA